MANVDDARIAEKVGNRNIIIYYMIQVKRVPYKNLIRTSNSWKETAEYLVAELCKKRWKYVRKSYVKAPPKKNEGKKWRRVQCTVM